MLLRDVLKNIENTCDLDLEVWSCSIEIKDGDDDIYELLSWGPKPKGCEGKKPTHLEAWDKPALLAMLQSDEPHPPLYIKGRGDYDKEQPAEPRAIRSKQRETLIQNVKDRITKLESAVRNQNVDESNKDMKELFKMLSVLGPGKDQKIDDWVKGSPVPLSGLLKEWA